MMVLALYGSVVLVWLCWFMTGYRRPRYPSYWRQMGFAVAVSIAWLPVILWLFACAIWYATTLRRGG